MEQDRKIQAYFQQSAVQFDQLYHQRSYLHRLFNQWLRRPLYRRFELTMAACGNVQGKRILDVGCGSGRYAVALAERGAEVVGIDFANNMLLLANELAKRAGVASRCRFINANFLEYDFMETFNISLAIGFFDYIAAPFPFLEKLHRLTDERVILSFPRPGGWRALQRRLRYRLKGCPIYFHTQESMATYFDSIGYKACHFDGSWAVGFTHSSTDGLPTTDEEVRL